MLPRPQQLGLIVLSLIAVLAAGDSWARAAAENTPLVLEEYVTTDQPLTKYLASRGIWGYRSRYSLYAEDGWLNLVFKLNSDVRDWQRLGPDVELTIAIPLSIVGLERAKAGRWTDDAQPIRGFVMIRGANHVCDLKQEHYVTRKTDTLAKLLALRGVGGSKSRFALNGADDWVGHQIALNPSLKGYSSSKTIPPGTKLLLQYPVLGPVTESLDALKKTGGVVPRQPPPGVESLPSPEQPAMDEAVVESAEQALESANGEALAPPPAVVEKAWDLSLWDALKPGFDGLRGQLASTTASGYVGMRFGVSLASRDQELLAKSKVFGLLIEMRSGWSKGFRYYFDMAPNVTGELLNNTSSFGWSRHLVAYAFEFNVPWVINKIHVMPKVGAYSVEARIPQVTAGSSTIFMRDVNIKNALGLGIELDVEKASLWYILRGWAAQDAGGRLMGSTKKSSATSRRAGLDLFLKGAGFQFLGGRRSLYYLAFTSIDMLQLKANAGTSDEYLLDLMIPYAGLGVSLAW